MPALLLTGGWDRPAGPRFPFYGRQSYFYRYMGQFNVNDSINLLSKLTLRRVWNAGKVLGSYYYSKFSRKPTQWGFPISISFEPTTSCNLRCPECPSGLRAFTRPTGMLQRDFFRETIDQLHQHLWYLVFYFQGEPYLNPSFLDMVKYASSKKIDAVVGRGRTGLSRGSLNCQQRRK